MILRIIPCKCIPPSLVVVLSAGWVIVLLVLIFILQKLWSRVLDHRCLFWERHKIFCIAVMVLRLFLSPVYLWQYRCVLLLWYFNSLSQAEFEGHCWPLQKETLLNWIAGWENCLEDWAEDPPQRDAHSPGVVVFFFFESSEICLVHVGGFVCFLILAFCLGF